MLPSTIDFWRITLQSLYNHKAQAEDDLAARWRRVGEVETEQDVIRKRLKEAERELSEANDEPMALRRKARMSARSSRASRSSSPSLMDAPMRRRPVATTSALDSRR
jgi:septal ring factor EnvC (AmiA/AmiB activator)